MKNNLAINNPHPALGGRYYRQSNGTLSQTLEVEDKEDLQEKPKKLKEAKE